MLPIIPRPPLTKVQKRAALAVAATIDLLQITFLPMLLPGYVLDDALDVIAAVILVAICGFKWQFVLVFLFELIPIADLLPTWTAVVLTLPSAAPEPPTVAVSSPSQPIHVSVSVPPSSSAPPPPPRYDPDTIDVEAIAVPPVQPSSRARE